MSETPKTLYDLLVNTKAGQRYSPRFLYTIVLIVSLIMETGVSEEEAVRIVWEELV